MKKYPLCARLQKRSICRATSCDKPRHVTPIAERVVEDLEYLPRLAQQPSQPQLEHAASRGRRRHREPERVVLRRENQHGKGYLGQTDERGQLGSYPVGVKPTHGVPQYTQQPETIGTANEVLLSVTIGVYFVVVLRRHFGVATICGSLAAGERRNGLPVVC